MENVIYLRLIGLVLILIGVVLASNPELVSNRPVPEDTFKAVERRVWWGLFIGLGLLLQFHHQWLPWQTTVAATLISLLLGLLVARFIGIFYDGSVAKQWLNVGIEVAIMLPLIWWYFNTRS
ncbi:hypothetical protein GCM10008090_22640 [Arenicella chitinivorans]|uniref:DUF4345 domain-containing protein n=1 Tax=Arenicella chitinivorans TaxID=1329800 RepID=A0A918RV15_9GAMM|nr:DUF4345 family protein [Arenicella chitinivorans]GHA12232.1 hypothetical protein GCM10008090_22640 [Arenicella chitinivorans]